MIQAIGFIFSHFLSFSLIFSLTSVLFPLSRSVLHFLSRKRIFFFFYNIKRRSLFSSNHFSKRKEGWLSQEPKIRSTTITKINKRGRDQFRSSAKRSESEAEERSVSEEKSGKASSATGSSRSKSMGGGKLLRRAPTMGMASLDSRTPGGEFSKRLRRASSAASGRTAAREVRPSIHGWLRKSAALMRPWEPWRMDILMRSLAASEMSLQAGSRKASSALKEETTLSMESSSS